MRLTLSAKHWRPKKGEPDGGWKVVDVDSADDSFYDILAGNCFGHSMQIWKDGIRGEGAIVARTGIMADFDGGCTKRQIEDVLKGIGCSYVMAASKSHMKQKADAPPSDRWHVYIPFAETAESSLSLTAAVDNFTARHFGPLNVDPIFDTSRMFYPGTDRSLVFSFENKRIHASALIRDYAKGNEAAEYKKAHAAKKRGVDPKTQGTIKKSAKGGEYWRRKQDIDLGDGRIVKASEITSHTVCRCINPDHADHNPSAFVDFNDSGHQFVYCSSCGLTWWEKDWMQEYLDHWFYVDKLIFKFHGDEETEWEPMEVGQDWIDAPTPEAKAGLIKIMRKNALAKKKIKILRLKSGLNKCVPSKDPRSCRIILPTPLQRADPNMPAHIGNPLVEEWMTDMFGEHAEFIKNWVSIYAFANEQKLPVIVLNGGRGVGKSSFAEMVARLYPHISKMWTADKSDFNDEIDSALAHVDELPASEHGYAESRGFYRELKKIHGGEKNFVNNKYGLRMQVVNNLNLIITTNDMDPIHLDPFEAPEGPENNQFFVLKITRPAKIGQKAWSRVKAAFPGWVRTEGWRRYTAWLNDEDARDGLRYGIPCPITPDEESAYQNSHTSDEMLIPDLWLAIESGYYNGTPVRIDRHKGYLTTLDLKNLAIAFGTQKTKWIGNTFRRFGYVEDAASERRETRGPVVYGRTITAKGRSMWKSSDPPI